MRLLLVFGLLVGGSWVGAAVPTPRSGAPLPGTEAVTVVVSSLASPTATVKLFFYNTRAGFLKSGQWAFSRAVKPESKRGFSLPVALPKGEWAVAITQDVNNNNKIDKNFIGIPTEPYAFSNNVRPTLAAPDFNACKFLVDGPGKVVRIVLKD